MFKKSLILMYVVLVLLGSIAVAIVENSKTSAPNHPIPVVTPPDVGTGYLGDITIQGTAINNFSRIGAWGWNVYVNKVVDGPAEVQNKSMSVYLTSADPAKYPRGFIDPNIRLGDRVGAYGDYSTGSTNNILLTGNANYYLKCVAMIGRLSNDARQARMAGSTCIERPWSSKPHGQSLAQTLEEHYRTSPRWRRAISA